MKPFSSLFIVLLLCPLFASAQNSTPGPTPPRTNSETPTEEQTGDSDAILPKGTSKVRLGSFFYYPAEVTVLFDLQVVTRGIISGEVSSWGGFQSGSYNLKGSDRNTEKNVVSGSVKINPNRPTTILLYGDPSPGSLCKPGVFTFSRPDEPAKKQAEDQDFLKILLLNFDTFGPLTVSYLSDEGEKKMELAPGSSLELEGPDLPALKLKITAVPHTEGQKEQRLNLPSLQRKPKGTLLMAVYRPLGPDMPAQICALDSDSGGFQGTEE